MRTAFRLLLLAIFATFPTTAVAAVRALPADKRTLTAQEAKKRHCFAAPAQGRRGVATTTYKAPMSGFATVRLVASRGDWDLALFDARTGRKIASSSSFGARELAQAWIGSGDRLLVQGCRRSGGARQARVSVQLLDVAPPKAAGTPMLLRVQFKDRQQLAKLEALGADVTHHIHDGRADVIVAGRAQAQRIRELGFDFDVEIADLQAHYLRARRADVRYAQAVDGESPLPTGRATYRHYDDYQTEMKALAEGNSSIVKPITLPRKSFQGRPVQGLEIADGVGRPDGRPVFLLVAMHHAREWPSSEAAMEFAHMLVRGYGSDPRITDLMKRTRTIVVPLINPDGFISSRGAVDAVDVITNQGAGNGTGQGVNPNLDDLDEDGGQDPYDCVDLLAGCDTRLSIVPGIAPPGGLFAYRRKNCDGAVPDGRVPCELQYGVDPNRNYGYNWGGPGSSGEVMSQSYRGPGPWSEPETKNVHELSQTLPVTNIITIHNVAALILRPPGVSAEGLAPDEIALRKVGDAMGAATGYQSIYGHQLYDTSGTTEEWNYAQQGAFGYTIEIGPQDGEFHMPFQKGVVDEWTGAAAGNNKGLREALLIGAEAAANPAYHSVVAGKAPSGRVLRASKRFETVTKPTCRTDVGIAPFNSDVVHDEIETVTDSRFCADPVGPITVSDGLDYVMKVGAKNEFEWHLTPSTRPFVGRPQEAGRPLRSEETVGAPSLADQPPTLGVSSRSRREHDIQVGSGVSRLKVELNWSLRQEDYDLYVFSVGTDENGDDVLTPVGSGHGPDAGQSATLRRPEFIAVENPAAGRYRVRVVNYAGVNNDWTLKIQQFDQPTFSPGGREAWTLTCETRSGRVLATRQVEVDRGQQVRVDFMRDCARGGKEG